jgi:hypothetical protein
MLIVPKTKYDATRIARTLVNGNVPFDYSTNKVEGGDRFVFTTYNVHDDAIIFLFRNIDDVGHFVATSPLTPEQVKRLCDSLDNVKESRNARS